MSLNAYVAEKRRKIFEDLTNLRPPSEGAFDESTLAEGRVHGLPQLGATHYRPDATVLEFIYPAEGGASVVLTVTLPAPERIVFLPVPPWVIELIWQGEVDGSYHFESDARKLIDDLVAQLEPAKNAEWFGPRQAKRRD